MRKKGKRGIPRLESIIDFGNEDTSEDEQPPQATMQHSEAHPQLVFMSRLTSSL